MARKRWLPSQNPQPACSRVQLIRVELSVEEGRDARELAAATYEKYRREAGHYRNLERSHFLGKLGEVAVEKWLSSQGLQPEPIYRDADRDAEADLGVSAQGIEVKTWRPSTWDEWGRCVTPAQARRMADKSDAIVWAIADDEADPITVEIVGWSTLEDVLATDIRLTGPSYKPVANHQIELNHIRPLDELVAWLRQGAGYARSLASTSACRKSSYVERKAEKASLSVRDGRNHFVSLIACWIVM